MTNDIATFVVGALLLVGVVFGLLAGVGVLRMPDAYMRMQAATKAGTLGVACVALAVAVQFNSLHIAVEALLIVGFFFLTAPVAAHLIARAGFDADLPIWKRTTIEEHPDDHEGRRSTPQADADRPARGRGVDDLP